ncbi:MAG: alpha/beta hydrolase [Acidobacteriota bacterium]
MSNRLVKSWIPLLAAVCTLLTLFPFLHVLTQTRNSRAILSEAPPPYDHKVAYGSDPLQFGELRLPPANRFKQPYPVAVVLHGGCWMAEYGLGYMGHLSADLAAAGVATWNVEYRRVGDAGGAWPGTFADAGLAVDYVRTLAKSYPLDVRRVLTVGHSAGSHLALWVAARSRLPQDSPLHSRDPLPLLGVVALAGITDLRRTGTACDVEVGKLMQGSVAERGSVYDLASPLALLPLKVPQVIVQGDSDRIIPSAMASSYVEAARQKGDAVKLVMIEKAGHFELVDPQTLAWTRIKEEILLMVRPGAGK